MVHRRKSCVTPVEEGVDGADLTRDPSPPLISRLRYDPIFFSFLHHPSPSVMRAIARLSFTPLATLILSTAEAITYAKRREREEEEVTSLPRLERDWVLETISALFRPRFLLVVLEKKRRGAGEDVYGAPGT